MKTGLHPAYHQITVSCACGNTFPVGSTHKGDMRVEICAKCHPLYTGKANLIDTAGRVDRFKARQQVAEQHLQAKKAKEATKNAAPEVTETKEA